MAFYTGAIIREPAMENPTVVVLTDRNDLDDQLFGTFSRCQDLIRQPPTQAESRTDLRKKLSVNAGGVVFTTIQKFFPEEKGDYPSLLYRKGATSSSLLTRPTAASTTSSTGLPVTCGMLCPMPPLSGSRAHQSS